MSDNKHTRLEELRFIRDIVLDLRNYKQHHKGLLNELQVQLKYKIELEEKQQ